MPYYGHLNMLLTLAKMTIGFFFIQIILLCKGNLRVPSRWNRLLFDWSESILVRESPKICIGLVCQWH